MHRRRFVQRLGAALLAPATLRALGPRAAPARRLKRIGLQIYSLRDAARENLERTLTGIAAAGYNDVELLDFWKNFDTPPKAMRALLDSHGLRAPSTHIAAAALDDLQRELDDAGILGHEYLVVASFPPERRRSLDDYRYWADRLNRAGETARRSGVWIGFHNHQDDFAPTAGGVPYDVLVEHTDPALVRLELDIGNLAMTGRDPVEYMSRYGNRYWQFHVKDVPRLGAAHDTELGRGVVDIQRVLGQIDRIDEKHVYVEQETYPKDSSPLESVRRDYGYLSTLDF